MGRISSRFRGRQYGGFVQLRVLSPPAASGRSGHGSQGDTDIRLRPWLVPPTYRLDPSSKSSVTLGLSIMRLMTVRGSLPLKPSRPISEQALKVLGIDNFPM